MSAQQLLNSSIALRDEITRLNGVANTLVSESEAFSREDNVPRVFVGLVRSYEMTTREFNGRFGSVKYKFIAECGNGCWIYSECNATDFDSFATGMQMEFGADMGKMLTGRLIRFLRRPAENDLIPVGFIGDALAYRDARNQFLYNGAEVLIEGRSGQLNFVDADGIVFVDVEDQTLSASADAVLRIDRV